MKIVILLLLTLAPCFTSLSQTPRPAGAKPKVKTIYDDKLLELTTKELAVPHLRKIYDKILRVTKISHNIHDPTIRDTLWATSTGADQLLIFSNKYNSFLLKANVASQKLAFGKGIRVGSSKASFCKAFGLPTAFDGYQIADAESRSDIYFLFRKGVLTSVTYDIGWLD